ncbi:chemotaxis protein CheW [bacterium]|nr:chemotaxis protein CheW [bacterium]
MNNLALFNENYNIQKNIYFTIGKNKYALPLLNVLEVMELPQLDYPQKLPANTVGLLKFNNIILNVLDIRFYLNIEVTPYSIENKLIVAKTDETIFGLIVDKIEDIKDFENSQIERLPFVSENQIIDSLYKIDENTISILSVYAIEKIIRNGFPDKGIDVCSLFPYDKNSVEILQKRALNLSEKLNLNVATNVFSDNKFVAFSLNNTVYCLDLNYVKEFNNTSNIIPLPCSPDYIKGIMTVRGEFITVLNLKNFLNLTNTDYTAKTKVIIINSDALKLGLLVDEIYEILNVPEDKISNRDFSAENNFINAEIIDNNTVKPILNIEKLLSDEKLFINED